MCEEREQYERLCELRGFQKEIINNGLEFNLGGAKSIKVVPLGAGKPIKTIKVGEVFFLKGKGDVKIVSGKRGLELQKIRP